MVSGLILTTQGGVDSDSNLWFRDSELSLRKLTKTNLPQVTHIGSEEARTWIQVPFLQITFLISSSSHLEITIIVSVFLDFTYFSLMSWRLFPHLVDTWSSLSMYAQFTSFSHSPVLWASCQLMLFSVPFSVWYTFSRKIENPPHPAYLVNSHETRKYHRYISLVFRRCRLTHWVTLRKHLVQAWHVGRHLINVCYLVHYIWKHLLF